MGMYCLFSQMVYIYIAMQLSVWTLISCLEIFSWMLLLIANSRVAIRNNRQFIKIIIAQTELNRDRCRESREVFVIAKESRP